MMPATMNAKDAPSDAMDWTISISPNFSISAQARDHPAA